MVESVCLLRCIVNQPADSWLLHRQIFPGYSSAQRAPAKDGARAIMKEKRAMRKQASAPLM